ATAPRPPRPTHPSVGATEVRLSFGASWPSCGSHPDDLLLDLRGRCLVGALQSHELARRARVQRLRGTAFVPSPEAERRGVLERNGAAFELGDGGGSGVLSIQ